MKTTRQRDLMLIITVFVLLLSLFNAGTVFADDGMPPAEPIADDAPDITTEPTVIVIDQPIEESAGEGTSAETTDQTVSEILEQIPEDTQLMVLDENGVVEPLVTQNAAEIIATSDPMWCPSGQTPGGADCTVGYATAALLISALNGVTGDGTIYFMPTYSTNDLTFDHTNANLSGLGALTIQGGWNGSTGNAFALSGSTTFTGVGLSITNWTSAVTINDTIVNGAATDGITIFNKGNINLTNIDVQNSGAGISINNGFKNGTGFDVTISNANLKNNGLYVLYTGAVNLNNITVTGNNNTGAYLTNTNGYGNFYLTGTNTFNDNNGDGLFVASDGVMNLENISANNNSGSGVSLDNTSGNGVVITGSNVFNNNGLQGLGIGSKDDVALGNIVASGNGNSGATLGGVNIMLSGDNAFNNNSWAGLIINSSGNVLSSNISANLNTAAGVMITNTFNVSSGDVIMKGMNTFTNNGSGLYVNSNGNIELANIDGAGNIIGAEIKNNNGRAGNVTLTGINNFSNNTDVGLWIGSGGNVTVNNLTANGSLRYDGAHIDNSFGTGNVILTGTNIFLNNASMGLSVTSNGDIVLESITANDNGWAGVSLDNYNFGMGTGTITLSGVTANYNNYYGLYISSNKNTTLNNVTANGNGMHGLYVETLGNANIKCSSFTNNTNYGVYANMPGTLTFNGVIFSGNTSGDVNLTGGGSLVTNADCASPSSSSPSQVETQNKPFTGASLPLQFIPITSGNAEFNCELFSGTVLSLPNGDKVTFKCPLIGTGSLSTISTDELPGDLPEGVEYISGIQAGQSAKGNNTVLDALFTISFVIPKEMKSEKLSILYWDGNEWIDLKEAAFEDGRFVINDGYFTDDGYFEAVTNFSGSFVLVKK